MQLGMIGLGRMGANMVLRLMRAGHDCVVFDVSADAVKGVAGEGATGASSSRGDRVLVAGIGLAGLVTWPLTGHPGASTTPTVTVVADTERGPIPLERIGSAGEEFDPAVHEAVVYHEEQSAHEQHVQRVLRPGYRLGTRLLRPAQVEVAGPPRNGSASTNANDASANQGRHHDGQSTRN